MLPASLAVVVVVVGISTTSRHPITAMSSPFFGFIWRLRQQNGDKENPRRGKALNASIRIICNRNNKRVSFIPSIYVSLWPYWSDFRVCLSLWDHISEDFQQITASHQCCLKKKEKKTTKFSDFRFLTWCPETWDQDVSVFFHCLYFSKLVL